MIAVLATREGLPGGKTATGYRIDPFVPFVALPSTAALRLWVRLHHPRTGHSCRALVLDVGPWNERDHGYVFQPATLNRTGQVPDATVRPMAESGRDDRGRVTNKAGIDLGEVVWKALGMQDNEAVWWEFD